MSPTEAITKVPVLRRQEPTTTKKQIRTFVVLAFPFLVEFVEQRSRINIVEWLSDFLGISEMSIVTAVIPGIVWVLYVVASHVPLVDRLLHFGVTNTDPDVAAKAQAEVVQVVVDGEPLSVDVDMPESQRAAAIRLRAWANRP